MRMAYRHLNCHRRDSVDDGNGGSLLFLPASADKPCSSIPNHLPNSRILHGPPTNSAHCCTLNTRPLHEFAIITFKPRARTCRSVATGIGSVSRCAPLGLTFRPTRPALEPHNLIMQSRYQAFQFDDLPPLLDNQAFQLRRRHKRSRSAGGDMATLNPTASEPYNITICIPLVVPCAVLSDFCRSDWHALNRLDGARRRKTAGRRRRKETPTRSKLTDPCPRGSIFRSGR